MAKRVIVYFNDKYEAFANLLLSFLEDTYLNQGDDKVIEKFVQEAALESMLGALKEGREILGLDPFPHEWIGDTSNRALRMIQANSEEERYKKWVEWMMAALEAEAKRVGKL